MWKAVLFNMAAVKQQIITRTPFKKQADVIAGILRTNPILNDDEKASLNETVGVLTWLNQLQIHWVDTGKQEIPDHIQKQVFDGRAAQKMVVQQST